jgi:hypothetical protein
MDVLPTIPRGSLPSRSVEFDAPTELDLSSAASFSLDDRDGPFPLESDAEIERTDDSTPSSSTGPNVWRRPGSSLPGSSSSDK